MIISTGGGCTAPVGAAAGVVARAWLQRSQERDQIGLFVGREHEAEGGLVVPDDVEQRRCDAVVEVREGRSKPECMRSKGARRDGSCEKREVSGLSLIHI